MTIKAWDWDKQWRNIQTYEGHTHYIMNIAFNPKDSNTFVSACLDRTVKMWSIGSPIANFTMEAHDKGVNYVDFYPGSDKPYLVTTGDDKTVKVWDYLSKSCVQTMEGHTNNVSFAVFHPNLPIIISGSEDGTVKIWNSGTYRIEHTLSYALERAWCLALRKDTNEIAVGFDEGVVVIKLGRDEPTFSMDPSGKLIYTRNHEVLSGNLSTLDQPTTSDDNTNTDGSRIPLPTKDLGSTEIFATSLLHSPNGRFVTVVGDGEYIIYTALAWRNKSFGNGISFAWAPDSNTYAVLESKTKMKVFKNFKEKTGVMKGAGSLVLDALYSGPVLAGKGPGYVMFWDWETGEIVRRIDVDAKNIYWSTTGTLVAISSDDSFYILRYDRDAYQDKVDEGTEITDEGVEEAFEIVSEINESIQTAKWIGDCLIYTTPTKLSYFIGSQTYTISPFGLSSSSSSRLYLLGYIPSHNRVYLCDKDMKIYGYSLSLIVVEYQTAILRGEMDVAEEMLEKIPKSEINKVARFLEGRDMKELALKVSTDPDHKFDLALSLDDLDTAYTIVSQLSSSPPPSTTPSTSTTATSAPSEEIKWKSLGDRALSVWRFDLAKECFERSSDLGSLLLLVLSVGDKEGLRSVVEKAIEKGQNNLAFAALLQLGEPEKCVDLLTQTGRAPEAALFARTYVPSKVPEVVTSWTSDLKSKKRGKIASGIANPSTNPELFEEGWESALADWNGFSSKLSAQHLPFGLVFKTTYNDPDIEVANIHFVEAQTSIPVPVVHDVISI
ncbi:Coatomer subunit beta' [Leucoagaricus sp. SymC.cos]|nr:Coatomer subunit beta' [Leucoagaricus sp. SymC.cos]